MKRQLVIVVLGLLAVPLLIAMASLPPNGSPLSPTYTHTVPRYLERGLDEAGAENIVTDIILNYRGFDTNGEVTVIFTAMVAVFAVLLVDRKEEVMRASSTVPVSPVVALVTRALAPLIALFAVYVVMHGHLSPGGGFQGGTILGALAIVLSVVLGSGRAQRGLPPKARPYLQAAAVLTFVAVGLAGLTLFGYYLDYPRAEQLSWLRTVWLVLVEIGIGIGGATIIAQLFWTLEES